MLRRERVIALLAVALVGMTAAAAFAQAPITPRTVAPATPRTEQRAPATPRTEQRAPAAQRAAPPAATQRTVPPAAVPTAPNRPAAGAATQAANRGDAQTFGDWAVRCVNVKAVVPCEMFQAAMNKKTRQVVTHVSFAYVPAQDSFATQIVVPLGVALSKGVSLVVGTQRVEGIKFHRCERNGCYVEAELNKNYIEGLGAGGTSGVIRVVPYRTGKSVDFPLSLNGFAPAMAKLKELARQKSAAPAPSPASAPATPPPQ